jgi:uncharacterized protein YhdP
MESTEAALPQAANESGSHWARSTVLVTFCVLLLGALAVAFTRVIAARVPEQRATLEKLITERTGLAVRFDNVHFAWTLDGTSAVFERVELTDPAHGRVRVVAPELRVEFDSWDYLRHHQFSLGHVTLSSPDIEIIGDPLIPVSVAPAVRGGKPQRAAEEDEAALVRRFTAWAELMPNGRVEVEGARVHLLRRGDRDARTTFTLSQAMVRRDASGFNAFGTMLLSQDLGQSLFLSAKLEGLGTRNGVSGDLRVIARRVFLHKLPMLDAKGRGTLDATVHLQAGLVASAIWQASARELEIGDDPRARFDHFTVNGKLARDDSDFVLRFADLQLTRDAQLQRAPKLTMRVHIEPGTSRIARTTLTAERVPFMAAEFMAGLVAPQLTDRMPAFPADWNPVAGELRSLRFDSNGSTFSAHVNGAELVRTSDHLRISNLAARLQYDENALRVSFDPDVSASLQAVGDENPRVFNLAGDLVAPNISGALEFEAFGVHSGAMTLTAQGQWGGERPLMLNVANLDHAVMRDGWHVLAHQVELPALVSDIHEGTVVEGALSLVSVRDLTGTSTVDWRSSTGTFKVEGLAMAGENLPRLADGRGSVEFARGSTKVQLEGGEIDQLAVNSARLDWPRKGPPRLHATLQGELSAPLVRRALEAQGLEKLTGLVVMDADARGEKELRQPDLWRVSAQLRDAALPLGGGLPPVEKLAGTVRYGGGQLRSVALAGNWLGGPVTIESRRTATRGGMSFGISGAADAVPLLHLLGRDEVASRVSGQLAWSGSVQGVRDDWHISLASNLAGVESRLPEPFDKSRARLLPVSAQMRVDANGLHDFVIDGRDLSVHGLVENGVVTARFDVQGVNGELRRANSADEPLLKFERLELKRAPAVLAVAGALLPARGELPLTVDDLRYAGLGLGGLHARLSRGDAGIEFSLESAAAAPHQLVAHGLCANADGHCRAEFTADTRNLAALLAGARLPAEWPTESLRAAGELTWPAGSQGDLTRLLAGRFTLETGANHGNHEMTAVATLADGQIELADVQGTGPEPDQLFRGSGRVALLDREYDVTVDYEQVSLAASAVPTPARARVARLWTVLRGTAARSGWAEPLDSHRVQWHGTWDAEH